MTIGRLAWILIAPLLLASCLFPGKFTSTLDIRKDSSFTFTYVGEVFAADENAASASSGDEGDGEKPDPAPAAATKASQEAKRRAATEALAKEQGYRSVQYLGDGRFMVDYAISGRLDHSFLFPFNSDAEAIFPWVAIEVRKDGTVRMKAPAFGNEGHNAPAMPGLGENGPAGQREGIFTLTTDAEIVMHNIEEGVGAGPVKTLAWRVTPNSKAVPTAVLRLNQAVHP